MNKVKFTVEKTRVWMLAFLVSSVISLPLVAEDNHDYSTYIKLKKNTTLTETDGGWPKADAWNPEGDMEDGKSYLVPSGISLASNTKSTENEGGTWPGNELAIEGLFSVSATGNRTKSAKIPCLALLPGGRILMKSAYGTINGDTLDIRGTNGAPSSIEYNYANANNNGNYYPQLNIAITGDADGVLRFAYTGTGQNYSDFQRAFRVLGGFADFHGTVIVDGERTWLRPMTTSVTFDIGGTLVITNGANVYVDTVSPTFGSLVMAEGSTLQIAAGKTVAAAHASFADATVEIAENSRIDLTGSFAAASPVKLKLSYAPGAYRTDVMTLPVGKGALREEDFVIAGEPQFRYVLSVDSVDGIQVLWIKNLNPDIKDETTGYVYQKIADGSSASYTIGSYNMAGNWSEEGAAPHHGTNYYTEVYFRDKGTKEDLFQGDSLTQAYTFRPTRKSFKINDWRVVGVDGKKPSLNTAGDKSTYVFDGLLTVYTTAECAFTLIGGLSSLNDDGTIKSSQTYVMKTKIRGASDAVMVVEGAESQAAGTPAGQAICEFPGDMSEYYGTLYVGKNETVRLGSWGLTNGTLAVKNWSAKIATTEDSSAFVPVKKYKTETSSTVDVSEGKEIAVLDGMDITGTLTKAGGGMLSVGGIATVGADAELDVAEGSLKIVSTDAVNGITVGFAEGAKLVVDVSAKGDLKEYGARNTQSDTPFVSLTEGGRTLVSFTGEFDGEEAEVVVCTVSATAALPEFRVSSKHSNLKVASSGWRTNEDGTKSFFVKFVKAGMVIVVR